MLEKDIGGRYHLLGYQVMLINPLQKIFPMPYPFPQTLLQVPNLTVVTDADDKLAEAVVT